MANESMPPRPEIEFDFNLPHDIDADGTAAENHQSVHNHQEDDSSTKGTHDGANHKTDIDMHKRSDDGSHSKDANQDAIKDNTDSSHQNNNYKMFEKSFSDDDDAPQAIDHSWSGHQAQKPPPKSKKSPRDNDEEDEASPRTKKPRQSLFGEPMDEADEDQYDELFEEWPAHQAEHLPGNGVQKQTIGNRMSSLNLEQQETEDGSSELPLNLGFGFGESDRESISPRESPAPSDGGIVSPPDTQPAYGLRQGIARKTAYTYVDQDESGNFDPASETRNNAQKLKRSKAAKAAKAAQQSKKCRQRAPKEAVMKCIVKLRIERFGNVKNITDDQENWPDNWSDIDSEAEREQQEDRPFFRRKTPNCHMQLPIQDPRSEVDDLTGHPVARGCISCRIHGIDCSMVAGGTYPCQYCCDLDQNCEPIMTPTEKGRCKQCVGDEIEYCSFEGEPSQAICDHCTENEHICEALPPVGYRTKRINIDQVIYTEDRPYIQCTNCRQEKKRCSLKKKNDKPPCKQCKKHNIGCTFYDIPKVVKEKKAKAKGPTEGDAPEVAIPDHNYFTKEDLDDMYGEDVQMVSRSPTPEIEMEDNAGHKGKLTKITTSFAHPIKFGGIVNTSDCNFCELPMFGFVGHFEKEVHVIRWYSGHGYTEVGGGHAENNNGSTTMCQDCTINRAQILACDKHDMQHIFPNGTISSFDETFADLLEAAETSTEIQQQLQRWCSMCFSPAAFSCCTLQMSLLSTDDEEPEIDGCGLRLCTACEIKFRENFDEDISLMAETLDRESKAKEEDEFTESVTVVRADVGFLCREGLLMKNLELEADEADI